MAAMTRIILTLFLLLGALAVFGQAKPHWLARLGLAEVSLADLRALLDAQRETAEILNKDAIVRRRLQGKFEITCELLDGRLTLFEAAARFRNLESMTSEYINCPRKPYPGESEEERLCRQVIAWACHEAIFRSPSQADQLVERLEAELQEHLCQHGTVQLPQE